MLSEVLGRCSVARPEQGDEDEESGEDEITGVPGGGDMGGGAAGLGNRCF